MGIDTAFSRCLGIEVPLICGAMYPCSNPELVAAVSAAGGVGIVQPMTLVYVFGYDFRQGLRRIRALTDKPIGVNLILESSAKLYEDRIRRWLDIALEEKVRFFITALGNPRPIVEKAKELGATVYHDVTERKWALKARDAGVDGLICVNSRAGGHAGTRRPEILRDELLDLGLPLVCAGGVGCESEFVAMLRLGYAGVQLGTRFIATDECRVHPDYKQAIIRAAEDDITLTDKISGVPVAVIRTPYIERIGTQAGPLARFMLRGRNTKKVMRAVYALQSLWQLRQASLRGASYQDYWLAGKSVATISAVEPAGTVVRRFRAAAISAAAGNDPFIPSPLVAGS
ncbi:MAG: nitronate monooxygenase [Candidatus Schekmanbacteria bacterium]|nr:nitronate monooxygenase [Candidatus Schekmanbacteria bacterium]